MVSLKKKKKACEINLIQELRLEADKCKKGIKQTKVT